MNETGDTQTEPSTVIELEEIGKNVEEEIEKNIDEEVAKHLEEMVKSVDEEITKIDRQPPPGYYYPQGQGQYQGRQPQYQGQGQYYGTPTYQQRLDGQTVYYVDPPRNVSRRGETYNVRDNSAEPVYRDEYIFTDSFDTVKIRNRFVQRVYTILSIQLFFSFGFVFLVTFEPNTKLFVLSYYLIFMILGMLVFMITMITLVCVQSLRRAVPCNFIMLSVLTLGMTMLLMVITATAHTDAVVFAIGTTAVVCLLVSIFACQTSWDVTGCGMCLCISMIVLMIFGLIIMLMSLFGIYIKWLHIIFSAVATLLFCFWLMYDTQQIVGGRHIELSPEEYIYGALTLYIDIVYIFMHILMLYELCR